MRKLLSAILSVAILAICIASCKGKVPVIKINAQASIKIATSYGSDDGNYYTYKAILHEFTRKTGINVIDDSSAANEEWKAKINGDFQTDNEPDVLMYFTSYDANEIIRSKKIVPVREIQEIYPEYAANMRFSQMPMSIVDGKFYAVPVNGYWEGLFVNKRVLAECGITKIPDASTTWQEFMEICEQIKQAGYTPIAVSLQEVPHYLMEYMVFNEGSPRVHTMPPSRTQDASSKRWIDGLDMIKDLYEKEYFPQNTLVMSDFDAFSKFCNGEAAFAIDGSWRVGWLAGSYNSKGELTAKPHVKNVDDFTITYVPGNVMRKSTDIISGISMGYFITRRAWDDPQKRDAVVQLVMELTSDEAITDLSQGAPTALKNPLVSNFDGSSVHIAAQELIKGSSSTTPAAQDVLSNATRTYLFGSVRDVVTGKISAYKAFDTALLAPLSSELRSGT